MHEHTYKSTVLDSLPLDVIQYVIIPYLDYDSRIQLNQCLPVADRVVTRMTKEKITDHDLAVRVLHLRSILEELDYKSYRWKKWRLEKTIHIYTLLQDPRYFAIINHNYNFRKTVFNKIQEHKQKKMTDFRRYTSLLAKLYSEINILEKKIL